MAEGLTVQTQKTPDSESVDSKANPTLPFTSLPWITNATAILTVLGVMLYGLLNVGYSAFYQQFGISPDEVGLGYFATLARSTGLVLILLSAALFATASYILLMVTRRAPERLHAAALMEGIATRKAELDALRAWMLAKSEEAKEGGGRESAQEQKTIEQELLEAQAQVKEAQARLDASRGGRLPRIADRSLSRTLGRLAIALATIALVAGLVLTVRGISVSRAESVKAGQPVSPISLLGLNLLAIHADAATISPAGEASKSSTSLNSLSGRTMMYLGQANGTIVLYDARNQRTLTLPQSLVILQIIK
jgi:hypothetical protein